MRSRKRTAVVLGALVGILAAAVSVPSVASAFCGKSTVVRDYLSGVKRSAPIREVPALGELPFGPARLHLEAVGSGLATQSERIGFNLTNRSVSSRRLGVMVESEHFKVSPGGKVLASLGVKRRNLESMEGDSSANFLYRVPATPAYYRVDIRFSRSGSGRTLAAYSLYTRVMQPRVDLRVKIETPSVVPGEVARATLLNMGTVPLITPSYDYGFRVQAFTGEKWLRVPDNPRRLVPKRGGSWQLPPGTENRGCLRYLVPAEQTPGLFRFAAFGLQGEDLLAEFEVTGQPSYGPSIRSFQPSLAQ